MQTTTPRLVCHQGGDARQADARELDNVATYARIDEIRRWLSERLLEEFAGECDRIDPFASFECYGLGSIELSAIGVDIEDWLGCRISRSVFSRYDSVDALARHLAVGR